jgi:hypothetical protein
LLPGESAEPGQAISADEYRTLRETESRSSSRSRTLAVESDRSFRVVYVNRSRETAMFRDRLDGLRASAGP